MNDRTDEILEQLQAKIAGQESALKICQDVIEQNNKVTKEIINERNKHVRDLQNRIEELEDMLTTANKHLTD